MRDDQVNTLFINLSTAVGHAAGEIKGLREAIQEIHKDISTLNKSVGDLQKKVYLHASIVGGGASVLIVMAQSILTKFF